MEKWQDVLGKNCRNQLYLPLNKKPGRKIADSKLLTKKFLSQHQLPTPSIYATFAKPQEVLNFQWEKLPGNFVVKPSEGYGGEGILVVRKGGKWAGEWELMDGEVVNADGLKFHILDILEGKYSLFDSPDRAFIEERIKIHPVFAKYAFQGTPDIRVIVFNRVPVMAMLRLPTASSHGKANLHQGAIGLGIDLATGITTWGVLNRSLIKFLPGTKIKLNGLKIPFWKKILNLAVTCQEHLPSMGYLGVDLILDVERGPMILEINSRPGLDIQICNRAGLKKRLDRVEGLEVRDAEHGVNIGAALFAESFSDKVKAEEGIKIVGSFEDIEILSGDGKERRQIKAKVDTGAFRSSIDKNLADDLGLLTPSNILFQRAFNSALGSQKRSVIGLTFYLKGSKIKTTASVANRAKRRAKFLIGRNDLKAFMIRIGD